MNMVFLSLWEDRKETAWEVEGQGSSPSQELTACPKQTLAPKKLKKSQRRQKAEALY